MLNGDETMCSSGVKVVDCPDCVSHWVKENPSYLNFLQDVYKRGTTLDENGTEVLRENYNHGK